MNMRRFDYWGLLGTLGAWAVIGSVAGLLGTRHWMLDLFAHFRLQYILCLVPLAIAMAVRRAWFIFAVFAGAALLDVALLAPAWWPRAPVDAAAPRSLLILNVQNRNTQYARTLDVIRRANPDFILLMEVDPGWLAHVNTLTNSHPFSLSQARSDNYGVAFYSRFPLRRAELRFPGEGWVPVVDVRCNVGGQALRVLGAHPLPPWSRDGARLRNDLLHALPALVGEANTPTLLAGDLNLTTGSRHFHWLCVETGLRDASLGHGLMLNWPAFLPALLRVRKDHVLASANLRVGAWEICESVGSDHLPLLVRFHLPPP